MRRWFGFMLVVGALLCGLAVPAAAAEWHFTTLDGSGGTNGRINGNVGEDNAVTLYGGEPHVWYLGNGDLRHGWWSGTEWSFETLDGAGGSNGRVDAFVGQNSAVALYGGQPHVWYLNNTNGDLRHAWWDGTEWHFETLDGAGGTNGRIDTFVGWTSAATLYGGRPHVWYMTNTEGDLRHAWWDGTEWHFETLDGAGGTNGRIDSQFITTTVTLYGGQPHVWYYDDDNADLRHAWWNGAEWFFEALDGAGGPNGRTDENVGDDAAVTHYSGQPHVWYSDLANGDLRHAWWNGVHWSFETLDGAGGPNGRTDAFVGQDNAVTLYRGQPHVWYSDGDGEDLRHAWWNGSEWLFETLDGAGGTNGRTDEAVGYYNAVTLYGGEPHVWYRDATNGDLRHGWFS